ncbi:MAG: type IV pilin protein [Nitrospiria bacterium]
MFLKEGDKETKQWPFIRDEQGGWAIETLFICVLVGVLMGILIPSHKRISLEAREITLRSTLTNIRKSIELYYALHNRYPDDLRVLARDKYKIPVEDGTFFSSEYITGPRQLDPDGNLLDPFGKQYRYEQKQGSVHSSSRGYETW